MMSLVKLPVPVPSEVWGLLMVGLPDVFQQTPLAVTFAPLSFVTPPPLEALVDVTALTAVVLTVGTVAAQASTWKSLPVTTDVVDWT